MVTWPTRSSMTLLLLALSLIIVQHQTLSYHSFHLFLFLLPHAEFTSRPWRRLLQFPRAIAASHLANSHTVLPLKALLVSLDEAGCIYCVFPPTEPLTASSTVSKCEMLFFVRRETMPLLFTALSIWHRGGGTQHIYVT